jgi:hypothetical protein
VRLLISTACWPQDFLPAQLGFVQAKLAGHGHAAIWAVLHAAQSSEGTAACYSARRCPPASLLRQFQY